MADWDEAPKLPPANLSYIERWTKKFEDALIPEFVAEEISGEVYTAVTDTLASMVARTVNIDLVKEVDGVDPVRVREAMAQTVNNFIGQRMPPPDTLKKFAAALAGNLTLLRVGKIIRPWCGLKKEEWHAAQIIYARRYVTPSRKIPGAILRYRILTGPAASEEVETFTSKDAMFRMARRIGVLAKDEFRLFHPREMVGMYSMVMLAADEEIQIRQYYEKQSMNKRNKTRAKYRARAVLECPTTEKGVPCHFCQMGVKACWLATHPDTYERKTCKNGHEGWLSKRQSVGFCLECSRKIWHARRGQ